MSQKTGVSLWNVIPDDILAEIFVGVDPFSFLYTLKFVCKKWWLLCNSEKIWKKYNEKHFPVLIGDRFDDPKKRAIYYAEAFAYISDVIERRTTLGRLHYDWQVFQKQRRKNGKNLTASGYINSIKRKHLITDELKRYHLLKYDIFPKHVDFYFVCLAHMMSRIIEIPFQGSLLNGETFRKIFEYVKTNLNIDRAFFADFSLRKILNYYTPNGKRRRWSRDPIIHNTRGSFQIKNFSN